MTHRPGRVATHRRERLVGDWALASVPAGSLNDPSQLADTGPHAWIAASRPGTVAAVLRDAGAWSLDHAPCRFDAQDWWYRTHFDAPQADDDDRIVLGFDGLATLAEVWLNGEMLLSSDNMFIAHEHEVRSRLRAGRNELTMRFRSLDAALAAKRPRPAWRAPMIENQQLRWFRTSLLGRTPGWSPPAAAVGPWRDVWIETRTVIDASRLRLQAWVDGTMGMVRISGSIAAHAGHRIDAVVLEVEREGQWHRALLSREAGTQFAGTLQIDKPALWWPHTHGEPALYAARLCVSLAGRNDPVVVDMGRIGLRTIEVDTSQGRFAIRVNGTPVFCRGACWTPLDPVCLSGSGESYANAIAQVRQAGMNMLRVGGTMIYEDDAFHDACDEQGVLVWQDLMFANMDYPVEPAFLASVKTEVRQQLGRLQSRPSLAVVCGNSEVEQQAAMWGATRECWTPALFHEHLPSWVRDTLPHTDYWPSSAHGGAFPFQGDAGTTSFYGVGAYLRPQDDARRSDLSFATECLAFANLPDASTIARMPGGESLKTTHPAWKSRTPRDLGAGWDFEDVRDHYLADIFKLDPSSLRAIDHERYLELGRVVSGEVMAAAFKEWRRAGSRCGGALVWFLRDLWAGAGWGLLDDQGRAKAAMHIVSRALQPVCLAFTDEGGNGLFLHATNEHATPVAATLSIAAFNESAAPVGHASRSIELGPRATRCMPVAEFFDGFLDLGAAYRFGPPPAQVVVATLLDKDARLIAQDFYFPSGFSSQREDDVGLAAVSRRTDAGIELTIRTERLAQHVRIDWPGYVAADNHFHLAPHGTRTIMLRGQATGAARRGTVSAVNCRRSISIEDSA